jgi:CRP-like cAMP-binding protein
MPKLTDREVSLLSKAKHGLIYLSSNDWALIADKAARVRFFRGDSIVRRGKPSDGVYLLLSGRASVEIPSQPHVTIGAGEICGEMSFLEEAPASANVIAKEDVEAYHLEKSVLESLFELFPHLASRFYHSLAFKLSQRLRQLIGPA